MYPLSAYNAEKSQNAKSYLEKKKMGIHVWLPICKGSSLWTGGTSRFTNNESPYTSSNTWSWTQLMSEPLAEESTLINDGTDHS